MAHHHFCYILLYTESNPSDVGRTIQGCEYQEVEIMWGYIGGCLPHQMSQDC